MRFIRPDTLIAKIKYIFGLALAVVMLASVLTGNVATTDRVYFEAENQTTSISVKVTNKSSYGIHNFIHVEKLEKEVDGEWVELQFDSHINEEPALYYAYPNACIFPGETLSDSISCDALFAQETAPAGHYRLTFGYYIEKAADNLSYASCEFTVFPAPTETTTVA